VKIALVYDVIYPYVKGGAERRYYEIGRRLAQRHEIHLFGMKFWPGHAVIRTDEGIYLHGVCEPKPLYVRGRRSISQALYFITYLLPALIRDKFDLIDCCSTPYFPMFACKLCSQLRGTPLMATWLEYWGDEWHRYLGRWGSVAMVIEKASLHLPDWIVAISEHTKTSLVRHGVSPGRIRVIPLGIDWKAIEASVASREASDVIFVGRLIKEKNVDQLIWVVKRLAQRRRDIKCLIVGDGPERQRLERLVSELDLLRNLKFWGFVPTAEEVYSLMRASKVFALPSIREGFGLTVIEANACGLPVITVAAKHNAASDLVVEGQNGFICDPTEEAIAERLELLLEDAHLRAAMSDRSLERARGFDWDLIAVEVEDLYYQTLSET